MLNRKEFMRVTPESVGIDSGDIEWLLDQLESGFTEPHGLMIMRHGKICAEGWWNPYAPGIRHGLQSHSKTYAATAIGIAYTEGIVKLDERIIDIFPEYAPEQPSENQKRLTVHDVLCMGCGMDEMPMATEHWIRDFLHTPVNHTPGTTYMYNSVGSSILSAIIVKKTGMSMHEYLKPRLYDKIGIFSDNHRWMKMPDGCEVGGGGLFATTEDNLRLMKLYADGGVWEGERILDDEYVKRATTLQNESATEAKNNPLAKDNFVGYGYQIWMCRPNGVYRADGAMGQFTIVVPDKDMIIAITENASGAHWAQTTLDVMWEFLERIENHPAKEENTEKSERLKNRMGRLALPNPKCAPYSPIAANIEGRQWRVIDGDLYMEDVGVAQHMSGCELPQPIDVFCFHFTSDEIVMDWENREEKERLVIATDGSRRHNTLPGRLISQVLLSGAWISENKLEVKARYIETCKEETLLFTFEEKKLKITNSTMEFGMQKEIEIFAEAED